MRVALWDTRRNDASKDFAGGMGVGMFPGHGGIRGRIVRHFYRRDRRPAALLWAYLAAIFRRLGHEVVYLEDRLDATADLYVFSPALMTLPHEVEVIRRLRALRPNVPVLVVGTVASVLPEAFAGLGVTVVKGEAEQLLWKLEVVLARPDAVVQLGTIEDLDALPLPDWSPFGPQRFRVSYDFWRFPTALIQASRGCTFKCNYCPYIILENSTRFREPQGVLDEIRRGIVHWGFRSFKFRDPLFGLNRRRLVELAEGIARLPQPIQFSIESRIELLRPEILQLLHRAGLTSITVGIETPSDETLRQHGRIPVQEDKQREFIAQCRRLGIRTVAGFMIGFPSDTERSIRNVASYAKLVGPTFANFNIVTPYPGTEFFQQVKQRLATDDWSRYTVYEPVLKTDHLTAEQVRDLHAWCFRRYYFRWEYLRQNAALLWPWLRRWTSGSVESAEAGGVGADVHPGSPAVPPPSFGKTPQRKGLRRDQPHQ